MIYTLLLNVIVNKMIKTNISCFPNVVLYLKPKSAKKKMHLKMTSAEVVCCSITDELSNEANSVDPEQTAPIGAVWSGSTLFAIEAS